MSFDTCMCMQKCLSVGDYDNGKGFARDHKMINCFLGVVGYQVMFTVLHSSYICLALLHTL